MENIFKSIKAKMSLCLFFAGLFVFGCKKLVEVSAPVTSVNSLNVFNNDQTAIAVLTGIYEGMIFNNISTDAGPISLSFYASLSADELTLYPGANQPTYSEFYKNALSPVDIYPDYFTTIYASIYTVNSSIEGLNASTGLTPAVKTQLLGEATFMRAFLYFYLVNLYGDVPLILTSNYKVNSVVSRTPKSQVWQQIIADLKIAQNELSSNYLDGTLLNTTNARVRPTKWAATALLARSYLYNNDWQDADIQATSVINNSSLFSLSPLNSTFLANSTEAIWQLQPITNGLNSDDAQAFIIPSTGLGGQWDVYLGPQLLNSFERGDQRRANWVDSTIIGSTVYYYAYKYKISAIIPGVTPTEFEMVMRLGEQYLIRAEAEANEGGTKLSNATSDLNSIRSRAGLTGTTAVTQTGLLTAIQHERQVELFTEMGQRWFDLKRTGTVDAVMNIATMQKGGIWHTYQQLYPLKNSDLKYDVNLKQTPGY